MYNIILPCARQAKREELPPTSEANQVLFEFDMATKVSMSCGVPAPCAVGIFGACAPRTTKTRPRARTSTFTRELFPTTFQPLQHAGCLHRTQPTW